MSATGADALLADAAMAYALAELAVEPVEEAIVADDSVDFLSPVTDQPEDAKYLSIQPILLWRTDCVSQF